MRNLVLSALLLSLSGCATGDFAHIDERYEARLIRCEDPLSHDRSIFVSYELCAKDAKSVRDQSRSNQYSLRRIFGEGGAPSQPVMINILR